MKKKQSFGWNLQYSACATPSGCARQRLIGLRCASPSSLRYPAPFGLGCARLIYVCLHPIARPRKPFGPRGMACIMRGDMRGGLRMMCALGAYSRLIAEIGRSRFSAAFCECFLLRSFGIKRTLEACKKADFRAMTRKFSLFTFHVGVYMESLKIASARFFLN